MKWLNGKKTFLGATAAGLLILARTWFPEHVTNELVGTFGAMIVTWTGVSYRLAVKK